ncbi:hypothetical protein ACLOJK_022138 [Asimina triloba]
MAKKETNFPLKSGLEWRRVELANQPSREQLLWLDSSCTQSSRTYKKIGTFISADHVKDVTPKSQKFFACCSRGAFTAGLPPAWVDDSEEIAASMQRARTKMAELVKAHAKALMPSFGDSREDQHRIEVLTQEVTDLLKKSEKRLQKLSVSGYSEDSNVRKNVQRSLATDLQSLSMELRKKQSTYLKRLRQQKEGQDGVDLEMNLNGNKSKQEDDDFADASDAFLELVVVGFNEYQMSRLKKSEAFTAEREREINQIVESVNDLAQIMKDLSVLVIDQGTIVDRIDYNIQNVASSVEEGFKQLQKPETSTSPLAVGSGSDGSPHHPELLGAILHHMFIFRHHKESLLMSKNGSVSSEDAGAQERWIVISHIARESKEGGNGHVCNRACHIVLHHVGASDSQGDYLVILCAYRYHHFSGLPLQLYTSGLAEAVFDLIWHTHLQNGGMRLHIGNSLFEIKAGSLGVSCAGYADFGPVGPSVTAYQEHNTQLVWGQLPASKRAKSPGHLLRIERHTWVYPRAFASQLICGYLVSNLKRLEALLIQGIKIMARPSRCKANLPACC